MALLSLLTLVAVAMTTPAAPPQDGNDVQIPAEIAAHIPKNIRGYFLVFLVNPATPKDMPQELFLQHQAYLRQQVEAGTIKLVGPLTDGGRIRGMKIISAASAEQARATAEGDPAVKAGVFAVEVHPAMFPSLAGLKIEYSGER
jgi:uncharacterized protein YciI